MSDKPDAALVKRRQIAYITTLLFFLLCSLLLTGSNWNGNSELHTMMELTATLLALMVGLLSLVRFYSKKDNTFLFAGVGFFITGLLDGYHAFVTSSLLIVFFPSAPPALIAWSWLVSGIFLSVLLFFSWLFWLREDRLQASGIVPEHWVYGIAGLLALAFFAFFALVPLPAPYQKDMLFPRPQEFIPAFFYFLAFVGYYRKGHWKTDPFEFWLMLAIIVSFCGEALFMSCSTRIYDARFDAVHVVKIIAYGCALTGLMRNIYSLWFQLNAAQDEVTRLNTELEARVVELQLDIEYRTQAERELELHRDHLEELVVTRTAESVAAKERAELANRAKSIFLANMSHELRTPLNAILGYAQLLKRSPLNERQTAGVNTIEQSGEHLLMLINDILDLAKIEAGKFELALEAVNLATFLVSIADIIRVWTEQKGLQFTVLAAPDSLPTVQLDGKRCRQILLNLLSNAVKFTDQGEVTLRVTRLNGDGTTVGLRFAVQDTGIGMNSSQMAMLFQPFEQVSDLQHRAGGSGLGLTITRQLARLMGSDILVESEAGRGCCFTFDLQLPLVEEPVALGRPQSRVITGYLGSPKTVLIVDDVATNLVLLAEFLDGLGFITHQAENGQIGLEMAQQIKPDLMILDVVMPVMNGLELTERLRQHPALADLPIIIASANTTWQDKTRVFGTGANAFISKPINFDELATLMQSCLHLSWRYQEDDAPPPAPKQSLVPPPANEIKSVHQMALRGSMRDIRKWCQQIVQQDEQYRSFAEKLDVMAADYQSKAILSLIEEYLEQVP